MNLHTKIFFVQYFWFTSEQFKKAWKEDAAGALSSFIKGLGDAEDKGESAITMLSEMGLTEVRLRDSLLRAANAGNLFNNAIETGTKAWEDNTALTNEANKRYGTLKNQIIVVANKIKDFGITIGNKLMPSILKGTDKIEDLTNWFSKLSDEQIDNIVKIGLLVTAAGPLLSVLGKITSTISGGIKVIGTFTQTIGVMKGTVTTSSTAVNGLASVFNAIKSPIGLACAGIGVAVGGITIAIKSAEKETRESFTIMGKSASDFITGIENAKSHLDSFNSTLFVSTEEQQKLKKQMNEVQQGITNICKTASDERRGYTQKEIIQLDEYFTKLRNLKNREMEIQQSISVAITQQAKTNSETFQGTLDEYKIQSQEWINTATEQKNNTIALIEQATIEEVALLNQRYNTKEERQSEAYQKEYNSIMEQKQIKINAATEEVAKVSEVYANGYLQRSQQNDSFFANLKEYINKQENLENSHAKKLEQIKNGELWYVTNTYQAIQSENETFAFHQNDIWNQMYKDMSDSQVKQLGVWLAQVSQTELYGGEISDETRKMVNSIIASYDSMPNKTKEAMKNAMSPMVDEMEKAEPSLFEKAKAIGDGIISRLKRAFDEHSPSKKTRQIMKFAMQPMQEEMEKGRKKLISQAEQLANGVNSELENVSGNIDMKNGNYNLTRKDLKNIFYNPTFIISCKEVDNKSLDKVFNYVNERLGKEY